MQTAQKRAYICEVVNIKKKKKPKPFIITFLLEVPQLLHSIVILNLFPLSFIFEILFERSWNLYKQAITSFPLQPSKANIYCYNLSIHPCIKMRLARTVLAVQPFYLIFHNPHTQSSGYSDSSQPGQLLISINNPNLPLCQHITGLVASAFSPQSTYLFVHLQSKIKLATLKHASCKEKKY